MAANKRLRQPELAAEHAHFVFKKFAQRLDELHVHALGQAADIVMRLDRVRGTAGEGHALDHVGIKRALRQKFRRAAAIAGDLLGLAFEYRDEQPADDLALLFGIANAEQRAQKKLLRIHVYERDVVVVAK